MASWCGTCRGDETWPAEPGVAEGLYLIGFLSGLPLGWTPYPFYLLTQSHPEGGAIIWQVDSGWGLIERMDATSGTWER